MSTIIYTNVVCLCAFCIVTYSYCVYVYVGVASQQVCCYSLVVTPTLKLACFALGGRWLGWLTIALSYLLVLGVCRVSLAFWVAPQPLRYEMGLLQTSKLHYWHFLQIVTIWNQRILMLAYPVSPCSTGAQLAANSEAVFFSRDNKSTSQ